MHNLVGLIKYFIKCSEKCARRDWSKRVHYISIKHARYVTRVHCRGYNARSLRHQYERAQFTVHFLKEIKKKNTQYKTNSDLNAWKKFCESLKESRAIENIPANELDLLLSKFFISVRKQQGHPTTVFSQML